MPRGWGRSSAAPHPKSRDNAAASETVEASGVHLPLVRHAGTPAVTTVVVADIPPVVATSVTAPVLSATAAVILRTRTTAEEMASPGAVIRPAAAVVIIIIASIVVPAPVALVLLVSLRAALPRRLLARHVAEVPLMLLTRRVTGRPAVGVGGEVFMEVQVNDHLAS
jgi:hypothetical protein